jgi:chemotaxis protein methyltransferase CheR
VNVDVAARGGKTNAGAAAYQRNGAAAPVLHEHEFEQFRGLIYRVAGISLSPAKKPLVAGRLAKRLRHHAMASFGEYYSFITAKQNSVELQTAVDLLTTNETHFFREPKHFDFLREQVLPAYRPGRPFRVWSAASSSGEEAYTIAMLLADCLGSAQWEILGSDISTHVLEKARQGLYSMERAEEIPRHYLSRFCLKGTGNFEGSFMIERPLRERVRFTQVNLVEPLPDMGEFDVIFLRNVMIYFDQETKRGVVGRLEKALRPGGHLLIGHSESLNGVTETFKTIAPSIYRRT